MIRVEKFEVSDLDKMLEWNNGNTDADLLQWAGSRYKHPLTKEQLECYFTEEVGKTNSNIYVYKILLEGADDIVGTLQLKIVDRINKIGWISRVLIGKQEERGKGYGTMAVEEVLKIAFEELELKTVGLGVFDFNYPAIKCYQKVGFSKVKFINNARKAPNGYWNLYEMYITKMQWNLQKRKNEIMKRCKPFTY